MTTSKTSETLGTSSYPFDYESEHNFSSGANRAEEIRALIMTGNHPGVAVDQLSQEAMAELEFWACSPLVKIFVDSGAFGEVSFGAQGPEISGPITEQEWEKRLTKYDRLARVLGKRVYLVAPDCVAHQAETLERLRRYAGRVARWLADGANVIVPVQKGELPMDIFASQACQILGVMEDEVIWGVPMKKDATSLEELQAFVESVQPARIHLLGCGARSKGYKAARRAVAEACETTEVYSDAVRITALVGRSNGKNGGPRAITRYLDEARAEGLSGKAAKEKATGRAMLDELRAEVEEAKRLGWYDPELEDGPSGQLDFFADRQAA